MYLLVVTREMVDSCMLTVSATSCSTSGFMASAPWSKKARWRSTMVRATLSSVSFAGIQALDEPARLLELVLQVTVVGARIPAVNHLFVMAIDTQIR